ncbi:hypothetical protein ACEPPU_24285 [Priestia aryabhattai]|uniref:hypothetical protein n=1 Tax=Priestia aryabhattai TaxID=412384 RepID=UPI0035AC1665
MKVFKMNDIDWVAAETEEQAKFFYGKEVGFDQGEVEHDFVGEVSLQDTMLVEVDELPLEEQKMAQTMKRLHGTLFTYKPFSWVIEHEKITKPCVIASTEY